MQFYTNQTIIDDFKNYIKVILTRTNQFTGLTYAEDPTIFAYETGNELGGPIFGDMWVPNEWTEQIAVCPHLLVFGRFDVYAGGQTLVIYQGACPHKTCY